MFRRMFLEVVLSVDENNKVAKLLNMLKNSGIDVWDYQKITPPGITIKIATPPDRKLVDQVINTIAELASAVDITSTSMSICRITLCTLVKLGGAFVEMVKANIEEGIKAYLKDMVSDSGIGLSVASMGIRLGRISYKLMGASVRLVPVDMRKIIHGVIQELVTDAAKTQLLSIISQELSNENIYVIKVSADDANTVERTFEIMHRMNMIKEVNREDIHNMVSKILESLKATVPRRNTERIIDEIASRIEIYVAPDT
ncbi:MAG: hypothetical protein ACTSXJ_08320 [Candidatus Baldrarchaeia archaeon]